MNTAAPTAPPLAPVWRRFAAALYDGLLLLALWLSGTLLIVVVQDLIQAHGEIRWQGFIRIYYFVAGLLFFGWCWTHGGRTPGMLAWRLRLLREDYRPIRWPVAAIRYGAMLICWTATLLPLLAAVPALRERFPLLLPAGWIGLALLVIGLILTRLDGRRRAPQDRLAGTVMLAVPKNG